MKKKCTRVDEKKTGKNIEHYMKEANLTVPRVARKLDVTDNAVRNYIKGVNLPGIENMYRICKCLDVDIKDLIVEKGEGGSDEAI